MNRQILSRAAISAVAAAGLLLAAASAPTIAAAQGDPLPEPTSEITILPPGDRDVHYRGKDRNWFNPDNWSRGQVPGAGDAVVLDKRDDVVIDPARGAADGIELKSLTLKDTARLETYGRAVLAVRKTSIDPMARLTLRSSAMIGDTLVVGSNSTSLLPCPLDRIVECELRPLRSLVLNPTPKSKRDTTLKSSVGANFGLGGLTPASISRDDSGALQIAAGEGHYATLTTDTVRIDGRLSLSLYYGFKPKPGDSFQILTAKHSASGKFRGIPEGGYVGCTDDNIAFRLTYRGGDGNDVVLTAEQSNRVHCLLLSHVRPFDGSDS